MPLIDALLPQYSGGRGFGLLPVARGF